VVHAEVEWSRRLESSDDRAKHRLKSWAGIDIIFQYNCIKTTRYNPFQQSSFIRVPLQQITTRGSGTRAPRVGRQGQVYTTSVLKKNARLLLNRDLSPDPLSVSLLSSPPPVSSPRTSRALDRGCSAPFRAQIRVRRQIPARRELVEPRVGCGTCEWRGLPSHSAFAARHWPIDLVSTAAAILLQFTRRPAKPPVLLVDSYDAAGKEIGNNSVSW
jgi:hypothetical protein